MAGAAGRLQVALVEPLAALDDGDDVIDLGRRRAVAEFANLTHRMAVEIPAAQPSPVGIISTLARIAPRIGPAMVLLCVWMTRASRVAGR